MFFRQTRTKHFKAMWEKISASNTRNSLNSHQELNSCRISQDRKDWVNIRDFFPYIGSSLASELLN